MDRLFESDSSSFLFDPTSHLDSSTSFLSFSSFADLDSSFPTWDIFGTRESKPPSNWSDTSSPSPPPPNPFEIFSSAFEPATPVGDIGIFHTPSKAGPSRYAKTTHDSQTKVLSHRASSSSENWHTPATPALTTKSSSDSFSSSATGSEYNLPPSRSAPFSWDDASSTLASSSYDPTAPTPLRSTSNPTLGSARQRPPVKPIASMPALQEEEPIASTPSQWFDGSEYFNASYNQQSDAAPNVADDVLADDFGWVFGDFGLGETVPVESTLFAAFQKDDNSSCTSADLYQALPNHSSAELSWLPGPSTQDDRNMGYEFFSQDFTIDPMAVMATNGVEEQPSRPLSAPRLNGGEGSGQVLSVQTAEMMSRSVSSDAFYQPRTAPTRDLFSYAPQQLHSAQSEPSSWYSSEPPAPYNAMGPAVLPRSNPAAPSINRRGNHQLSIQINPPQFSSFMPSALPPTPQSATFSGMSQPLHMARAGTQPPPIMRKLSSGINMSNPSGTPAHLLRAQAIVQMQEAKEDAERQELRRQAATRRVGMAEASVMQPHVDQSRARQPTMGWEGQSMQTGPMSVLTTTPLVTVHPPPAQYYLGSAPSTPHRVHPPPYSGPSRQVARLPSPTKRKASNLSPARPSKARSPSSKRKPSSNGGGFSWGEATFINFTSDDAAKLLTGVAPSGSQSKRKREEEVMRIEDVMVEQDGERIKRSRNDD